MRKLASVRRISEIKPIDGADVIECARVDGWYVVVKKGEYKEGDLCIYCEIDSWIPQEVAPFLCKSGRDYQGVFGERLKTIKLRGQVSQGLILPLTFQAIEGEDITERLGILKWERPIPAQLQGQMKGNFPSFIKKTDQERVQNIDLSDCLDTIFQVTTKLDGSSMTIYNWQGEKGVCSRNVDLKLDQEGNTFVTVGRSILERVFIPDGYAIQGELMGPGIQGNKDNLEKHDLFVFDIWDINRQEYISPLHTESFCSGAGLSHVPILGYMTLSSIGISSIYDCIVAANGTGMNSERREGLVFKSEYGSFSFKAISNEYLLKND